MMEKLKNIDWVSERIIKILVPTIFFLPLLTNSSFYFPFIVGRTITLRLILGLVFGLYLVLYFRNRHKFRPLLGKIGISYIALVMVLTLSSLLNGDFMYSFWGNWERMEGLLGFYYLIAFLLVILGVYRHKKAWIKLIGISAFASFIVSYVGVGQHFDINLLLESSGGARVSSTLGNATFLASYALFHLFFSAYLFFKDKRERLSFELIGFYILDVILIAGEIRARSLGAVGPLSLMFSNFTLAIFFLIPQLLVNTNFYLSKAKEKISKLSFKGYFLALMLVNFSAMFNTQTRGALVGMMVAIFAIMIFVLFSKHAAKQTKQISAGALLLVILLSGGIYFAKDSDFVQRNNTLKRMTSISLNDITTESRLLTWEAGIKGLKDKPIFGWGEERFNIVFNQYFPAEIFKDPGSRVWFDRPHNIFVQKLVVGGLVGFAAYMVLWFFIFKALYGHYKKTNEVKTISIFGGLAIAYMVQNFFVFDSINTYILFILFLASVTFVGTPKMLSLPEMKRKPKTALAAICFLACLVFAYVTNVPQMYANKNFVADFKSFRNDINTVGYSSQQNQDLIDRANAVYLGRFEFRQVYSELVIQAIANPLLSNEQKLEMVQAAEAQLQKSIEEQPDNVRHQIFLINMYLSAASLDKEYDRKNIELIQKALPMSPTRSQLFFSLGRAYADLEEYELSEDAFKQGIALNPDVFEAHTNLLALYIASNQDEKAEEVINTLYNEFTLTAQNYSRLGEFYMAFEQEENAMAILEEGLSIHQGDLQLLAQATIYAARIGDLNRSSFYLDQMAAINRTLAEQILQQLLSEGLIEPITSGSAE